MNSSNLKDIGELSSVSFFYAKRNLEKLVKKANRTGEAILITRQGRPPVVLVPLRYQG